MLRRRGTCRGRAFVFRTASTLLLLLVPTATWAGSASESGELHQEITNDVHGHVWSGTRDLNEAVDALRELSRDGWLELRLAATEVLAEIGGERATAALSQVLWENQKEVRMRAARALAKLGTPEALSAMACALETEREREVRVLLRALIIESLPDQESVPAEESVARNPES